MAGRKVNKALQVTISDRPCKEGDIRARSESVKFITVGFGELVYRHNSNGPPHHEEVQFRLQDLPVGPSGAKDTVWGLLPYRERGPGGIEGTRSTVGVGPSHPRDRKAGV